MYPSSGYGEQSKYYDDDLLLNGTYQIITVTIHSSARDDSNPNGTYILRPGLLLAKSLVNEGYYDVLSTKDGYINGDIPTQFMEDVFVLGRKIYMNRDFILGLSRERIISYENEIAPAYISCSIFENKIFYNNMASVALTDDQWLKCQRINRVPTFMTKYDKAESLVRALLWNRQETLVTPSDLI